MEDQGWFVTANDLKNWTATNKRRAEETLPLLVKKLILASCEPQEIEFPDGDSVAVGGWDGMLKVSIGNEYIPYGVSGWEFGTNEAVKGKADSDYEKRTLSPSPLVADESTFVFVTSRLWTNRDSWVQSKKADGLWRDVTGMNAETLASWLHSCPAVHRWFSHLIGKLSGQLWDISQSWENFSNITEVILTPEFFIVNRATEASSFIEALSGKSSKHVIKSGSRYESLGFVLACLKSSDIFSTRFLAVKDQASWDSVSSTQTSLVLLPMGFIPDGIGKAISSGHHVIIAVDESATSSGSILLERRPRLVQQSAIEKLGFDSNQASIIYSDTKGYFEPILRHELLMPKDEIFPKWLENFDVDVLFSIFFAGSWDQDNEHDRDFLAKLSGMEYEIFEKDVMKLSVQEDSPVRLIGDTWQVISKVDFWFLIRTKLTNDQFSRLEIGCTEIIVDIDPSYELNADERVYANIYGIHAKFTKSLKLGVCESLAIISSYGDEIANNIGGEKASSRIRNVIKGIFKANLGVEFWYSLDYCTEFLAEAAPQEFLNAVDNASKGDRNTMQQLFQLEGDSVIGGGACHTNLLWALERLSWNEELFTDVSLNLAQLSDIDPGGRVSNRPFKSLLDIYLGWKWNTTVSHANRLTVIEMVLLKRFPLIGWRLIVSLLKSGSHITMGISEPKYQDWGLSDCAVEQDQYLNYQDGLLDLAIKEMYKDHEGRMIELLDDLNCFDSHQVDQLVKSIATLDVKSLSSSTKRELIKVLRRHLSSQSELDDDETLYSTYVENELSRLYELLIKVEKRKDIYLFDDLWPDIVLPEHIKNDYKSKISYRDSLRVNALEELFLVRGLDGIIDLVCHCNQPSLVGDFICRTSFSDEVLSHVLEWLSQEGALFEFATSYIRKLFQADIERVFKIYIEELRDSSDLLKAKFLACSPLNEASFEMQLSLNSQAQEYIWDNRRFYDLDDQSVDLSMKVARELLKHNKLTQAARITYDAINRQDTSEVGDLVDVRLISDILLGLATSHEGNFTSMDVHYIEVLIGYCQSSKQLSEIEIQKIEWPYIKALSRGKFEPVSLQKSVINNPDFFAQLVSFTFNRSEGKDEWEDIPEKVKRNRGEAAWYLLRALKTLPGEGDDGIDESQLGSWVDLVRKECAELGRAEVGDGQLGAYLCNCGDGSDGIWPHESVRSIIEKIESDSFDEGLMITKWNKRGATVRHPYAGGDQERKLEALYLEQADKIRLLYPRTARLLRSIARKFAHDAGFHDRSVELDY